MKDYMAILNLAENENDIRALTTNRPIASIPIGSRYRVIDFMLSNLVNAGIGNVGIFTESNSRSLSDHLGTGKPWDLNRKNDGLFLFNHGLCNLMYTDSKLIKNNMEYIYRSKSKDVILCSSYMVCNMDITEVIKSHERSGADITVVYTHTRNADKEFSNCFTLDIDPATGALTGAGKNIGIGPEADVCMEIFVMAKDRLTDFIYKSTSLTSLTSFYNLIFDQIGTAKFNLFRFDGYVSCINTVSSYFKSNMDMLDLKVSTELFRSNVRPIFTKIKDEPPTLYVKGSTVGNSLIADGCRIEGTVKDSLLGRYVDVEAGAIVENSIILQNVRIHKNARLSHVIIDKNVDIDENTELKGNEFFPLVIEKRNLLR